MHQFPAIVHYMANTMSSQLMSVYSPLTCLVLRRCWCFIEIQSTLVYFCAKSFSGTEKIRSNGHVTLGYGYINILELWFIWLYTLFCNSFISYQCPYLFSVHILTICWSCAKGVWTSHFFSFFIRLNLCINSLNSARSKWQFGGISGMICVHLSNKFRWWRIFFLGVQDLWFLCFLPCCWRNMWVISVSCLYFIITSLILNSWL